MRRVNPRAVALGNLFREQLDRYGELEHIAERWRDAVGALPPTTTLVVNADDPLVAELADGRERRAVLRRRRSAAGAGPHCNTRRTRSTAFAAARPTTTRRPTSDISATIAARCGHARPPLDVAARSIDLQALEASVFDLVTPPERCGCGCLSPVSTTSTTRSRPRRWRWRSTPRSTRSSRARHVHGGVGRLSGSRPATADPDAPIKNPAGANEAIRTLEEGGVPRRS